MMRMFVAATSRPAELAGAERGEMAPSHILPTGLLGGVVLIGAYVLRGTFHWLVSVVGR